MPELPRDDDPDERETGVSGPGAPRGEDAETIPSAPGAGEDQETIASVTGGDDDDEPPTGPQGEPPTAEVAGSPPDLAAELDFESIPRVRTPRPGAPGGAPPKPLPPGVSRPPQAPAATRRPLDPEAPTGDVSRSPGGDEEARPRRDVATQVGGFAGDATGREPRRSDASVPPEDAEQETVADVQLTDRQKDLLGRGSRTPGTGTPAPTTPDVVAGTGLPQSQGPVPASKFSRGTARDPVAGTAAQRGTLPGARMGPTQLKEGMLLADRYELVRRLGKGGMGEVWQARHTLLQGMRAIKVIKASISRDRSFRERFLAEGQTMMRVKHPGVVEVTDLDETRQNRELFMVMEYLQGRTAHDAARDPERPLCGDLRECVRIFRELAEGMQRIHDVQIVHKDLKTDNVLLVKGEDGAEHPKVIDFGLAKRLDDKKSDVPAAEGAKAAEGESQPDLRTTLSGTLAYMAPEQFLGEPSSFQSDIYSYGVMLYEAFTRGEYPMPRGSLVEYMDRHRKGVVPKRLRQARPDLDPYIAELADRCMAPRPEERPRSFDEIAKDLQWWLDIPVRAKRRKMIAIYSSAALALVAIAIGSWLFNKQRTVVSNVVLAAADGAPLKFANRKYHLSAEALRSVRVAGEVEGETGTPSLLVDGDARPAELGIERRDDKTMVVGTADLSALVDGEHKLALLATADGRATAPVAIVVDRAAPVVTSVTLAGGEPGPFTNAPNPAIEILTDTESASLERVDVSVVGKTRVTADRDPDDPRRWTRAGLVEGDGECVLRVVAVDLAGNRSKEREFRLHRDVVAPELRVEGLYEERLHVRSATRNVLRVASDEPIRLKVTVTPTGAASGTTLERPAGTQFELPLDEVPPQGAVVMLVATDLAGNTVRREFPLRVVPDVVRLQSPTGDARRYAPKPGDRLPIRLSREYPFTEKFSVTIARSKDAEGNDAPAARVPLDAEVVVDPKQATAATLALHDLPPEGEYVVGFSGLDDGARADEFRLVADRTRPAIRDVTFRDDEGNVVSASAWSRTQRIRVEVSVADLSLRKLTVNDKEPNEAPGPGTRTYTFVLDLPAEGENAVAVAAEDEAGNVASWKGTVKADWTDPVLSLASPRADDDLRSDRSVAFAGTCSERDYDLVVAGLDGETRKASFVDETFSTGWQLPAGEHNVTVYAQDRANRRSQPVSLRLNVTKVAVARPDQYDWPTGVTSRMRKLQAGSVVIDGRTRTTVEYYLDRTEVTNRQYRAFLDACAAYAGRRTPWDHEKQPAGWSHVPAAETWNDPKWNADDLPVVNVAWWDAYAYAKWTARRLPTEAEWVKAAAQKDGEEELRQWPPFAGTDEWKPGTIVTSETANAPLDATKGDDVSPSGCLHMGGNVSEWVDVPWAPAGEAQTGVRGGSFWTTRFGANVRRVPTKLTDPSRRARTTGFRCAVDAEQVNP